MVEQAPSAVGRHWQAALRRHRVPLALSLGLSLVAIGACAWLKAAGTAAGSGLGWTLALMCLASAAVALGASVRGGAVALLERALVPRESARALVIAFKQAPLHTAFDAVVVSAIAGSLLGAALLPVSYWLRFGAAPLDAPLDAPVAAAGPALPGVVLFAQGFPAVALFTYLAGFWVVSVLREARPRGLLRRYAIFTRRRPALAAVFSYGGLGLLGTWLLALPFCQQDMLQASLLSSFFVSFSALTTTGLANVDIVVQWNWLGQFVILLLVLTGGLGIFLFWALVSTAGKRLHARPLGQREMVDEPALSRYVRRTAILFASSIAAGTVLLALLDNRAQGAGGKIFRSLFHASSAFCNAGFTLDSTVGSFGSYPYGLVVSVLVVLGGLGPTVLLFPRSRHARVSALTSAALILGGALLFYFFAHRVHGNTLVLSLFQSVAARTAGFGWIDFGHLPDLAALWLMALMLIGACPGGTAGGIKLTVFYVLRRSFAFTGAGLPADAQEARRSAAEINQAFTIAGLFGLVTLAGTLVLGLLENQPGFPLLFEVVSAVSTTGLSMSLTPQLSPLSLLALVPIMLLGKVGPVLLLQAFFHGRSEAEDFLERIESGRVLIG